MKFLPICLLCMRELPHFHHDPTSSFLHSQPIQLLQVNQGSSVPLANSSFGMIPLSRHSVDRSARAFHSSTHNVVPASCCEVLSVFVESRNLYLGGSLWLTDHGVDVCDQLLGGSDLSYWQPFCICGEGLSPPVLTRKVLE